MTTPITTVVVRAERKERRLEGILRVLINQPPSAGTQSRLAPYATWQVRRPISPAHQRHAGHQLNRWQDAVANHRLSRPGVEQELKRTG